MLDYSGTEFPVTKKDFRKIEKQNNIKINVFGYKDKQRYPICISKESFEDHVHEPIIDTRQWREALYIYVYIDK